MNSPSRKLQQQAQQQQSTEEQQALSQQTKTEKEWPSVEALLQEDARQTVLPQSVEARLKKSISTESQPQKPWWRQLFG